MKIKLILAAMAILLAGAVSAQISEPGLPAEISSARFLPSTMHAGDVISIAIDIRNRATSLEITDLNASLDISGQFEGIETAQEIDLIKAGSSSTLIFTIRALEDIAPSHYPAVLNLNYKKNEKPAGQQEEILIPISGTENNIDVAFSPRVINPGRQTEVEFTLTNMSGNPVSNISFSWEEPENLVLPLGSDNRRYVSIIWPQESAKVSYVVAADPNISTGIYPLDVTISFVDSNGTREQISRVGLIVGGETDFEVGAEVLAAGQLTLSIANIGSNNAQSLVVKVPRQPGAGIMSDYTEILGNLDRGDFTIANIETSPSARITPGQGAGQSGPAMIFSPGRTVQRNTTRTQDPPQEPSENMQNIATAAGLKVNIEYTDTTGQRKSIEKNVPLAMQAGVPAGNIQRQDRLPAVPLALLAIIAIAALAYNHFRAKKKPAEIAKVLAGSTVVFAIAIFAFNSNIAAVAAAGIICAALFWIVLVRKE